MVTSILADSHLGSRSVTLEMIVKFADDSDAGRRIGRIIKEHTGDPSMLTGVQEHLRQSTGFVLIPERITSGRELILRIPEKPALEKVKQTLAKRPEVVSAELAAIQSDNPRLAESMLLLRFGESGDENELLQKAYADDAYGARVQVLATELCAGSDVPVLGNAQESAVLTISLDRYALLEQLTARLNALDDVDYAQPNSTVQFMK
jgi:hypothetical protein